jgi:hypothetical protein
MVTITHNENGRKCSDWIEISLFHHIYWLSVELLTGVSVKGQYRLIYGLGSTHAHHLSPRIKPFFSLCLQDWGRPGDLWNLNIQWHVPRVEETSFVFYVLDLILQPELLRLQRYAQGERDMTR